jgi:chemotaxis protein CheY-P-specific phosphatase CheC
MNFDKNQKEFFQQILNKALVASVFNISETATKAPYIKFELKNINLVSMEELIEIYKSNNKFDLCSISQNINNEYSGAISIVYSQHLFKETSTNIFNSKTTALLKEFGSDEVLEIGNEVINLFASELSNKLSMSFPTELPQYDIGTIQEICIKDIQILLWAEVNLYINNKKSDEPFSILYLTKEFQPLLDKAKKMEVSNVS